MKSSEYIAQLKRTVEEFCRCSAIYAGSANVDEKEWKGEAQIFELLNFSVTKWCYAWSFQDGREEKVAVVLQIPPVISPSTAVREWLRTQETERIRQP